MDSDWLSMFELFISWKRKYYENYSNYIVSLCLFCYSFVVDAAILYNWEDFWNYIFIVIILGVNGALQFYIVHYFPFPLTDEQIEIWLILKELQRRWSCQTIQNMEAHEVMVFTFTCISPCTYRICRLLTSILGSVVLADEYICFYIYIFNKKSSNSCCFICNLLKLPWYLSLQIASSPHVRVLMITRAVRSRRWSPSGTPHGEVGVTGTAATLSVQSPL